MGFGHDENDESFHPPLDQDLPPGDEPSGDRPLIRPPGGYPPPQRPQQPPQYPPPGSESGAQSPEYPQYPPPGSPSSQHRPPPGSPEYPQYPPPGSQPPQYRPPPPQPLSEPPPPYLGPGPQPPSSGGSGLRIGYAIGAALVAAIAAFFAVGALFGGDGDDVATSNGDGASTETADEGDPAGVDETTNGADSAESAAENDTGDQAGGAAAAGGSGSMSAGNDFDCVIGTVDDSLLPSDVSSLAELYTVTVSEAAARAYVEADFACHPDPVGSDAFIEALGGNIELGTGNLIELDTAETRCLTQYVVDNSADPYQVIAVGDTEADVAVMVEGMEACFDPEDVAYIRRDIGSGPQNYGDDERLDALYEECQAGDERTCDLLWVATAEGSQYSELAFDCAGRGATASGLCTPDIELDVDGYADLSSPGVDLITADCRDGDATACDLLGVLAPPGSKSETLGFTCGGLVSDIALPDCRTVLGE